MSFSIVTFSSFARWPARAPVGVGLFSYAFASAPCKVSACAATGSSSAPAARPASQPFLPNGLHWSRRVGEPSARSIADRRPSIAKQGTPGIDDRVNVRGRPYTRFGSAVRTDIRARCVYAAGPSPRRALRRAQSEEHTSELQSLMRISYAVFCLKKKNKNNQLHKYTITTRSKIQY